MAHPFDDGTAAVLTRSVDATADSLGIDASAYRRLMNPLVTDWNKLAADVLGPLRVPRHPIALAHFGLLGLLSAQAINTIFFRGSRAQAFFAGLALHGMLPLDRPVSAAFGLILGILGHAIGWPIARGGAQKIADSLASYFQYLGGEIVTNQRVSTITDIPPTHAVLLDLTPRQILQVAENVLSERYASQLRTYRYGPGVFKMDWALDGPIPWRSTECTQAGTVHVGATFEELARSEQQVWHGEVPERPFVLVAQQSLFDPSRAPDGKHTAWAYCHVPNGSTFDLSDRMTAQIERFAPGFRDRILAQRATPPALLERENANEVGGDINGGAQDLGQLFTRPVWRLSPYATPRRGLYICSSSTPPGGGVHGMCGFHAARIALQREFAITLDGEP